MQFCLLSLWPLVVKPIPPDAGAVLSPLFEKVKGQYVSSVCAPPYPLTPDYLNFLVSPKLQFTSRTKAWRHSNQKNTAKRS